MKMTHNDTHFDKIIIYSPVVQTVLQCIFGRTRIATHIQVAAIFQLESPQTIFGSNLSVSKKDSRIVSHINWWMAIIDSSEQSIFFSLRPLFQHMQTFKSTSGNGENGHAFWVHLSSRRLKQ